MHYSKEDKEIINDFIKRNYQSNQQYVNENFKKDQFNKHDGVSCSFCKSSIKAVKFISMPKISMRLLRYILSVLCSYALDRNICLTAIDIYGDIVFQVLLDKAIDPKIICSHMQLCNNNQYEYYTHEEYAQYILKDKPNKAQEQIDPSAKTWTMLQFTDIHYDLHYKEGAKAECDIPICCRADTISKNNVTAGKYGHIGKCDANKDLFLSFLNKAYDIHPDFIIYTGDNSPHDFWLGSQEEVFNITQTLVNMINDKFKHTIPIYPILGNHEVYPPEQFHGEESYILSSFSSIYKQYLTQEAYESFKSYGYYTMLHKDSNLRIVALNCLLCDSLNFHLITDHSQIFQMLTWFEETLRFAESKGEIVFLLDHIPFTSHFYMNECAKRMIALFDRFHYTIRGYFSGHTHTDEMSTVHRYYQRNETIAISYIAPALSPYRLYNPSFRLYEIDSSTKILKDYFQYRLYLDEANKSMPKPKQPDWKVSYKATELFKVKYMNEFDRLGKIKIEGEYIKKKYADGKHGVLHAYDKTEIKITQCKVQSDSFEDYVLCKYGKSPFHSELFFVALNKLIGQLKE